jgi:hypothetical protein
MAWTREEIRDVIWCYSTCNVKTGTTSNSFRKYLSNIPGNHDIKELQKTVILGTAHMLWKVVM